MNARAVIVGLSVVLLLARPAFAQTVPTPEEMGLNYSINFGGAFLINSTSMHTTIPTVGFAYFDLAGENFGPTAVFGLTADWSQIERNDGKSVQVVPLLFNYRQYGFISNYRVFVTLGLGLLATTDSVPEMQLNTGANFAWTAGLGFDISNNLNLQGRFIGGQNPGDDGMASVTLGYRF